MLFLYSIFIKPIDSMPISLYASNEGTLNIGNVGTVLDEIYGFRLFWICDYEIWSIFWTVSTKLMLFDTLRKIHVFQFVTNPHNRNVKAMTNTSLAQVMLCLLS